MTFVLINIRDTRHRVMGLEFLLESKDAASRRANIAKAMDIEGVTIPAVIDGIDASTETAYKAWPLRVVGIDRDGRIAFDGPFKPKERGVNLNELGDWLQSQHTANPSIR